MCGTSGMTMTITIDLDGKLRPEGRGEIALETEWTSMGSSLTESDTALLFGIVAKYFDLGKK